MLPPFILIATKKEEGYREKGFGKDGKIGNTIITFGLLIDRDKHVIGCCEVYRGSQYDGHTSSDTLERLKEKYQIDKVICVADAGMINAENVEDII
jgi:transposase